MADASSIDDLLKQATQAMQANRPKHAIRLAKQVLQQQPRNGPALFVSGMAESARGRKDVALNFMQMAAEAEPDVPEIQFHLGTLLGLAGRTADAEAIFERLNQRVPNDVNILANLGRSYYANAKWRAAADALRKASGLMPSHIGILEQLGASLQQDGDARGAEQAYLKALKLNPANPEAHYNLGTVRSRSGDVDGALASYQQAIRLKPDHAAAQRNLGHLLGKLGRFEEAIDPLRQAVRRFPQDHGLAFDLGYALAVTDRHDEALKVFRRALEANPEHPELLNMVSLTHFRRGDTESALAFAEQALEARPGDNTGLAYKAMALNELGRHDAAQALYDIDGLVLAEVADAPDGFATIDEFNAAFVSYIEQHHSLHYSDLNRSLKGGQSTRELLDSDDPAAVGFRQIIERAVEAYKAQHPVNADHPFLARRPAETQVACWANIIDQGGFQDVHFHPPSWLSGVYYPRLPAAVNDPARKPEGWLEFGRAYYMLDAKGEPPLRLVQPKPGLIVLFPAYFGHRTIPFDTDEKRISVAFDVMPADHALGF